MVHKSFKFDFNDLKLTIPMIETVMGHKDEDNGLFVTGLIEEVLAEAALISNIRAEYAIFEDVEFKRETNEIRIGDTVFRVNKIVFNQIKKADSVAMFLCTAGAGVGEQARKAMLEKDYLKGYIYDIAGSEIVEAAGDLMQDELASYALASGNKITNRYSPGYCGWDVAEQHKLFGLFPENYCGISLTDSALMNPVKSISGIIGIGKNAKSNPYTCSMCDMKDCVYRRIREKK